VYKLKRLTFAGSAAEMDEYHLCDTPRCNCLLLDTSSAPLGGLRETYYDVSRWYLQIAWAIFVNLQPAATPPAIDISLIVFHEFPRCVKIKGNAGDLCQISRGHSTYVEVDIPESNTGETCTSFSHFSLLDERVLATSSYDLSASSGAKITVTARSSNAVTSFVFSTIATNKVELCRCRPGQTRYVMTILEQDFRFLRGDYSL
jgi:hypothetical protein